jgi:hypothetical protein
MSSLKEIRQAQKGAARQAEVILQLKGLVKDIERCERTIVALKAELEAVNQKHQGRRTTREDIAYLTDLLACANKKLTWEKHMASLQKRTPQILEEMNNLRSDPKNPPSEQSNAQMLEALQAVQAAIERLQSVKTE